MSINPKKRNRSDQRAHLGDGLGKWVLGTLGLLWAVGYALRALRVRFFGVIEEAQASIEPRSHSRLGTTGKSLPHATRGHESRDANHKWIFGLVLLLLISGLIIHGIIAGLLNLLGRGSIATDPWQPLHPAAAITAQPSRSFPVLQLSAPMELEAFRAREEAKLHSYGWINRTTGTVHIPIERAMDLALQEGFSTRTSTNEHGSGPSTYELIHQRPDHRGY